MSLKITMQFNGSNHLTGAFEGSEFSDLLQTKNIIPHLFFLTVKNTRDGCDFYLMTERDRCPLTVDRCPVVKRPDQTNDGRW